MFSFEQDPNGKQTKRRNLVLSVRYCCVSSSQEILVRIFKIRLLQPLALRIQTSLLRTGHEIMSHASLIDRIA
jgi:hypothetical protein